MQAKSAQLTSSARILVLEARDILDYALVLLEPPPPDEEIQASPAPSQTDAPEAQVCALESPRVVRLLKIAFSLCHE